MNTKTSLIIFSLLFIGFFNPIQSQMGTGDGTLVQTPGQTPVTAPDQTPAPTPVVTDQARQSFIDRINGFRQTKGLPPLQRWVEGEACADNQAKNDATSGVMHTNFGACQELAQMTCPGTHSMDGANSGCLQQMWDEGPGTGDAHIHFNIMTNPSYTKVAIGIFPMSNGLFWIDMNFQ